MGGSADDGLFMFKAGFSPRRHDLLHAAARGRRRADTRSSSEAARTRWRLRPEDLLKSPFFPAYRADPTCDRDDPTLTTDDLLSTTSHELIFNRDGLECGSG